MDNVIFVYINRDIVDMKSFMFTVKQSDRDRVVALLEECQSYVDKREVPPMPEDAGDKKCAYCSYKDLCERNSNGE